MAGKGTILFNVAQRCASDWPSIFFVRDCNWFLRYNTCIIHLEILKTECKLACRQDVDCFLGLDHKRFNNRNFDIIWLYVLIAWLEDNNLNRSFAFLQTFNVEDLASFSAAVRITLWFCDHLDDSFAWSYGPFKSKAFNPTKNIALIVKRYSVDMFSVINVKVAVFRMNGDLMDQA